MVAPVASRARMRSRAITPGAARWKKPIRKRKTGIAHITQRRGGATAGITRACMFL
jgi:hypothetical protein